jgi:hypothetical protein
MTSCTGLIQVEAAFMYASFWAVQARHLVSSLTVGREVM